MTIIRLTIIITLIAFTKGCLLTSPIPDARHVKGQSIVPGSILTSNDMASLYNNLSSNFSSKWPSVTISTHNGIERTLKSGKNDQTAFTSDTFKDDGALVDRVNESCSGQVIRNSEPLARNKNHRFSTDELNQLNTQTHNLFTKYFLNFDAFAREYQSIFRQNFRHQSATVLSRMTVYVCISEEYSAIVLLQKPMRSHYNERGDDVIGFEHSVYFIPDHILRNPGNGFYTGNFQERALWQAELSLKQNKDSLEGLRVLVGHFTDQGFNDLAVKAKNRIDAIQRESIQREFETLRSDTEFDTFINKYKNTEFTKFADTALKEKPKRLANIQLSTFKSLSSASDFKRFISDYAQSDYAGLLEEAKARLLKINQSTQQKSYVQAKTLKQLNEFILKYSSRDYLSLIESAKSKSNSLVNIIGEFRENLQIGDESHCGLVVEIKKSIAQVESPVGLKYLQISQLYPAGLTRCTFINSVYQNPNFE
ncbi:hypothetical protein ACOI22_02735 [Glaciecola sp. 2405UD65-10]|uniref:hypothetical protein n=1 Tax=Glaciecola sp. 2405UD65-10 TaxID=3397244 RepID=UPI003B593AFB